MKTPCQPFRRGHRAGVVFACLAATLALAGCSGEAASLAVSGASDKSLEAGSDTAILRATAAAAPVEAKAAEKAITNPILFVTQVPTPGGDLFGSRLSTFANHTNAPGGTPRGGDLMIRYPDGVLRNLTQEAGFGNSGFQGANSIAVREPTVHWSGTKAIFSMMVGSPVGQYDAVTAKWQLFEVTGLARGQTADGRAEVPPQRAQPSAGRRLAPVHQSRGEIGETETGSGLGHGLRNGEGPRAFPQSARRLPARARRRRHAPCSSASLRSRP